MLPEFSGLLQFVEEKQTSYAKCSKMLWNRGRLVWITVLELKGISKCESDFLLVLGSVIRPHIDRYETVSANIYLNTANRGPKSWYGWYVM